MPSKFRLKHITWSAVLVVVTGALAALGMLVITIVTLYSVLEINTQIAFLCVSGILITGGAGLFIWINYQMSGLFKGSSGVKKKRKRKPKVDQSILMP